MSFNIVITEEGVSVGREGWGAACRRGVGGMAKVKPVFNPYTHVQYELSFELCKQSDLSVWLSVWPFVQL